MNSFAAIVIALLSVGADPPPGVSFVLDPATKRMRTYLVSGGHDSLASCEKAKATLIRAATNMNFEPARTLCVDQVDDGWVTAILK